MSTWSAALLMAGTGAAATIEAAMSWRSERLAAILQAEDGRILGAAVADAAALNPPQAHWPGHATGAGPDQ